MEDIILQGWKDFLDALRQRGVRMHLQTLRNWHHYRKPIPFEKTWPSPYARIEISKSKLLAWYEEVKKLPRTTP